MYGIIVKCLSDWYSAKAMVIVDAVVADYIFILK